MQSSNHPQSHTEQIQTTLPKKPLKRYKRGIAPGATVRVLLGGGKHSDKITTAKHLDTNNYTSLLVRSRCSKVWLGNL